MPDGDEADKWSRRPRPDGTSSRTTILRAACEEISEHGYGGSTIRGIAHRAAVNTSLVHYYFGSRDGVLTAALREAGRLLASAADGAAPDGGSLAGEELLRRGLRLWEPEERRSAALALIRSSVTHADAGQHLADVLRRVFPDPAGPCPHTVMISAQLIGLMVVRHITLVEPVASADRDELIALLAPVARHILADHGPRPAGPVQPSVGIPSQPSSDRLGEAP
ncbi:TetR family transcriptional regulator [Streptomyces sp. NPDC001292]|uniref:TetR/AcrR family transcriptional regulator n=1 Tax=Streptomyces sp. NPDC001292 TaxID=3364558 RepID=UPI00368C05E5